MKTIRDTVGAIVFATFIAGKVTGLLAWSWWWLLMPLVPVIGEILIRVAR